MARARLAPHRNPPGTRPAQSNPAARLELAVAAKRRDHRRRRALRIRRTRLRHAIHRSLRSGRSGVDCGGPVLLDRNPRSLSGSLQATLDSVLVFFIVAAATAVENVDDVEKYSLHVYAA